MKPTMRIAVCVRIAGLLVVGITGLTLAGTAWAHSGEQHPADDQALPPLTESMDSVLQELKRLRAEVAELRQLTPSFTAFMPEFSERFHVLHLAGEAGDWAVATHEMMELQRLVGVSKLIDQKNGQLMESFLGANLRQLGDAIQSADAEQFNTVLRQTIDNCNACHKATGSPFINVGLEADEILTMRHSHKFQRSGAGAHGHAQ